jgi:preprotein translocase subunit SecG
MENLVLIVHYLLCFFLISMILLQSGKGADIGAVFGGASQTVFGSRGPATFLNKATAIVAVLFLVTSISLAQMARTASTKSVIDKAAATERGPVTNTVPATPVEAEKAPTGQNK